MKPGAVLGLSNGFLLGYLDTIGATFSEDIVVTACFPKDLGLFVRQLYENGKKGNGAGMVSLFAVLRNKSSKVTEILVWWGLVMGSWLIGFGEEFLEARNWLRQHWSSDSPVSVFAITNRYLGGIFVIYEWSSDRLFLDKADELRSNIIKVYDESSGLFHSQINIRLASDSNFGWLVPNVLSAEAGPMQLEYNYLVKATFKQKYPTKNTISVQVTSKMPWSQGLYLYNTSIYVICMKEGLSLFIKVRTLSWNVYEYVYGRVSDFVEITPTLFVKDTVCQGKERNCCDMMMDKVS
jgi:hypothetical protein